MRQAVGRSEQLRELWAVLDAGEVIQRVLADVEQQQARRARKRRAELPQPIVVQHQHLGEHQWSVREVRQVCVASGEWK